MIKYGLENKIALITGGTQGLGAVMVKEFLNQGCTVIFAGRNKETGAQIATETGAEFFPFDLADRQSIEALFAHIKEKYGRLDILINNAANTKTSKQVMTMYDYDQVAEFFMVNSLGTYKCVQEAIEIMLQQEDKGCIVNISSTTSVKPTLGNSAYAASKGAVNSMTYAAAGEFAGKGIRINSIICHIISTQLIKNVAEKNPVAIKRALEAIPAGRIGEPEEYAKVALWLCSEDASYVNGSCVMVDGAAVHYS